MATTKSGDNQSGARTPKTRRGKATVKKPEQPNTNALLDQIAELERQLADERMQRMTLIETNNMLTRMLFDGGHSASEAESVALSSGRRAGSFGEEAAAMPPASFAVRAESAGGFVPCGMGRVAAENVVIGTIAGVGRSTAGIDLDTELGPGGGLGWDKETKESAFGFARHLVGTKNCLLLGQPADFAALRTVEDMVEYVDNNSVR